MAGLYGLAGLLPELSPEILRGAGVLALFGALYGSIKALAQARVAHLLSYGSLAFYSILWWHLAMAGDVTPQAVVYAGAAAVATGGLLLAWDRVRARYGDLDLSRIGGLARPMPRLATLMALLVMAAAGLPPFGFFSGYLAMLLSPSIPMTIQMTAGLSIILLTWFTASWYLFKLMQRLLFGPHRSDIRYEDLRPAEIAPLVMVLVILLVLGVVPYGWLETGTMWAALTP
jgi:NADH-quinone oxidoreductase subunit M